MLHALIGFGSKGVAYSYTRPAWRVVSGESFSVPPEEATELLF